MDDDPCPVQYPHIAGDAHAYPEQRLFCTLVVAVDQRLGVEAGQRQPEQGLRDRAV